MSTSLICMHGEQWLLGIHTQTLGPLFIILSGFNELEAALFFIGRDSLVVECVVTTSSTKENKINNQKLFVKIECVYESQCERRGMKGGTLNIQQGSTS